MVRSRHPLGIQRPLQFITSAVYTAHNTQERLESSACNYLVYVSLVSLSGSYLCLHILKSYSQWSVYFHRKHCVSNFRICLKISLLTAIEDLHQSSAIAV